MNQDILNALLSAAAALSGYPMPDHPITVAYQPHSFFVEKLCNGNEKCRFEGTFLDGEDPYTLHIDNKYEHVHEIRVFGMVLHEAVHLGQYHSGEFDPSSCDDSLRREKQAYFIQNEWLVMNGVAPTVFFSMGECKKDGG